ncbi:MBL fold metallo-hydrolase [Pontimicrobium sp. IMCC45349]|uniref:MBL fold metallo-hydrolase n=1 Tax=Pontimicrobium sp. IMCC45349 TaxID=3391574 RepID=UPI0039A2E502
MPIFKTGKTHFTTIILIFVSSFTHSQSKEINIKFLGNCGLYITDGTTHIYTDFPYKSGAHGYMEFDSTELDSIKHNSIFIFTHKHSDHYSKKHLNKILKEKGGQKYGVSNISELENLNNSLDNFEIKAFKTTHKVFGISFRHYSYLITWHGKRIYLSGDTTNPETIGKIKNMDWAFVPYWILLNAKEQEIEIDSKMLGVYHLYPEQIPSANKKWSNIDSIQPMTEQGEKITIKL